MTAVAGAALSGAEFNTFIRDNLNATAPGLASVAGSIFTTQTEHEIAERRPSGDSVDDSDTTDSTSYTDLVTYGPEVTVACGTGGAFVFLYCHQAHDTVGNYGAMSFEVSGAHTLAPYDGRSYIHHTDGNTANIGAMSAALYVPDFTAGTSTFTAKYRTVGGEATFTFRKLAVLPL